MGRRKMDPGERLDRDCRVRLNEFEKDQLVYLAKKSGMSVNSYVRKLISKDYAEYRKRKIEEAEEQNWE